MAFRFSEYLFNTYYTLYDKISDPNKDSAGKGTQERFINCIEDELDSTILPLIDDYHKNLIAPKTVLERYIPYQESDLGYLLQWSWIFKQSPAFRRNVRAVMPKILNLRGSTYAHEVMFAWQGLQLTLDEDDMYAGFDSPTTFDSPYRTFDSYDSFYSGYRIHLSHPDYTTINDMPNDGIGFVVFVLEFNQPIHATLFEITFNGADITSSFTGLFNPDFNFNPI